MRKRPTSRSRIGDRTLGESNCGRHSHSTFPLGATRAATSQSDRNAYSAIGGERLRSKLCTERNLYERAVALVRPERGLHARARPVDPDVDVVHVRLRLVHVLQALAVLVVTDRVGPHPAVA